MFVDFLGHGNPNKTVDLVGVGDYAEIVVEFGEVLLFFRSELYVAVRRMEGEGRPGVVGLATGGEGVGHYVITI